MMASLGMDSKKLGSRTLFEGVRIGKAVFWRASGSLSQNVHREYLGNQQTQIQDSTLNKFAGRCPNTGVQGQSCNSIGVRRRESQKLPTCVQKRQWSDTLWFDPIGNSVQAVEKNGAQLYVLTWKMAKTCCCRRVWVMRNHLPKTCALRPHIHVYALRV